MVTKRLFDENQYATTFEASIVKLIEKDTKQYKKEEKPSHSLQAKGILLDKTLFYATSGGQLNDIGILTCNGISIPITDVTEEVEDEIIHWTEDSSLFKQLQIGQSISGTIDWTIRFDHMQQHHGQHLLSKAFLDIANISTVSFHMGKQLCNIDLDTEKISDDILTRVQDLTNEFIQTKPQVNIKLYTLEEAKQLNLRKLDLNVVKEPVRIVSVTKPNGTDLVDLQACCGTHPKNSQEVQSLVILGTEKLKKQTRLFFICGNRVTQYAAQSAKSFKILSTKLGTPFNGEDVEKAVEQTVDANSQLKKTVTEYEKLICKLLAHELVSKSIVSHSKNDQVRVICHAVLDTAMSAGMLRNIAKEPALNQDKLIIALLSKPDLSASNLAFFISTSDEFAKAFPKFDLRPFVKNTLTQWNSKGGGQAFSVQGSLQTNAEVQTILDEMQNQLKELNLQ